MDNIDKMIVEDLSQNIKLPNSYTNTFLNSLNRKEKVKQYKFKKLTKALTTAFASVILCSGIAFAGYKAYEKIWKDPQVYNSLEERNEYNKQINEKDNKSRLEKNKVITIEEALSNSSNIFTQLGIEQNISNENIQVNSESFSDYYKVETNEYIMLLTPSGTFRNLINKNFDYNVKDEVIDDSKALELSNKIIRNLNLSNQYSLNFIEYTTGYKNNKSYNIWLASYYETINGIKNKYNCINISFTIINNNLIIENINTLEDNYEFQNNEVTITKEQAIEIAKKTDRKISILDIVAVDAELSIERVNSFVYAQEKTLGKEDEMKSETIDNNTTYYYGYSNEKIIRTIWKVKIDYDYNAANARNHNEFRGRYYYVDATTGEIIGGYWGQIGY